MSSRPARCEGSVSTAFLKTVLEITAGRAGLPGEDLLRGAGLDPAALESRTGRVPLLAARGLCQEAFRRIGDPGFGLHVAEQLPAGAFDLVDRLAQSCATLGEAFALVARYKRLLVDTGEYALTVSGRSAHFIHRAEGAVPWLSELLLGLVVLRARRFTGLPFSPRSVSFMHAPRAPRREYDRLFQGEVLFEQPIDGLIFDRELLDLPLSTADPILHGLLSDYAALLSTQMPTAPSPVTDACAAIVEGLKRGDASLVSIAERLATSPRSLQRQLQELGTSHRDLLAHLRLQIARHYLEHSSAAQPEMARALGYSSPNAFLRAFKRWSGTTPGQHRRQGGRRGLGD